jgi:hypothetical protein
MQDPVTPPQAEHWQCPRVISVGSAPGEFVGRYDLWSLQNSNRDQGGLPTQPHRSRGDRPLLKEDLGAGTRKCLFTCLSKLKRRRFCSLAPQDLAARLEASMKLLDIRRMIVQHHHVRHYSGRVAPWLTEERICLCRRGYQED